MPTIYLNEQEVGGPATGIGFPNLRSCVGVTCVRANGSLVGAHLTDRDDVEALTPRLTRAIGLEEVIRVYLIGGYTMGQTSPHGAMKDHPGVVAVALGYHGRVWMYDTGRTGYLGLLLLVDQPDLTGAVRVRYKNWAKVDPVTEYLEGEAHPYKDRGVPIITVDVARKPKRKEEAPRLILHDLPLKTFTVVQV